MRWSSRPAPLVTATERGEVRIARSVAAGLGEGMYGGLAINLAEARRVRLNGRALMGAEGWTLEVDEAFTLCRKYLSRSAMRGSAVHAGPVRRDAIGLDDAWLQAVIRAADTSFLASIAPDGMPDVAHRGGPAGFLLLDAEAGVLSWEEYVGDGVFKSAGNVRATARVTLLVPDFESGDEAAIVGRAEFRNERVLRSERRDALEQHRSEHPVQGYMRCEVQSAWRLQGAMHPRERLASAPRMSSASAVMEQAPQ